MERKHEILALLKARGHASLGEIADHLGLSKQGALRHLEALIERGLVASAAEPAGSTRKGPGRPQNLYHLLPAGEEMFPRSHRELANELLEFLPDHVLEQFFARRAARLEVEFGKVMDGVEIEDRVRALARAVSEHGYMAEAVTTDSGQLVLRQGNCPIADVAASTGLPCRHEQALYQRLLGVEIDRAGFIPNDEPACVYVIKRPAARPALPIRSRRAWKATISTTLRAATPTPREEATSDNV